ncbi:helix-turn-helix domain-containing protein [Aliarcobacter skirrowii]|uniref:Helix-turn-helix domain-containing protein n=1 Tax=Aliarcobacter skirrowii TaxID=28200 RepID=A0AAW9DCD6_9BACT|nr:helix-turn-helix domain-containing protein [Aliarcobacter skirrowii]MDX4069924.1 helix-turn-helix domain-containing protein [Aliarcobacter skirrowii]
MIKLFEKITKINQEAQNQKLRLFAKVDFETKIQILEQQKQIFHKLKSAHSDVDNTILTLSSLILAIDKVVKKLDDVNLNAIKLRNKNNKSKIKRQKILGYWAIVRTLKLEQKMSFRDIATYFAKYHKLQISYSTVYEIWNELEKKGNKNNEKSNF